MRSRDPVELVAASILHLTEAIAVILFLGMIAAWVIIYATRMPI